VFIYNVFMQLLYGCKVLMPVYQTHWTRGKVLLFDPSKYTSKFEVEPIKVNFSVFLMSLSYICDTEFHRNRIPVGFWRACVNAANR
jgi:hypothetical protein